MKIYIDQDQQKLGPYSKDEARELVYSGKIGRSSLASLDGSTGWVALETLLSGPDGAVPPVVSSAGPVAVEKLRDPKEQTALIWLYIASVPAWLFLIVWTVASFGIILPIIGLGFLLRLVGELWFAAYLKTNAVRVSESQLPEVFKIVQSCCQRLGMVRPEVYVMQQNIWNAFAAKIVGRRMVVLLSGAVDSILLKGDMQQLAWLVGHELAHHRAGHLDLVRKLANMGSWCVWLKLWYSRRAELTCDRMGLFCAGSLQASQLALVNATVGAQLASQVNIQEAVKQWYEHRNEFFVKYRTLYSTHPHHLARLENLGTAAAEFGLA